MRKAVLCSALLAALVGGAGAAEAQSLAVSPGQTGAFPFVAGSCPTFSWGAVDGAELYELAVFAVPRATGGGDTGKVALEARIPGSALAWTPSREQCLGPGRYSWSVRALGGRADGQWSEPLFFAVDRAAAVRAKPAEAVGGFSADELETAVRRILEGYLKAETGAGSPATPTAAAGQAPARPDGRRVDLNSPLPGFSLTTASGTFIAETTADGNVFGVAGVRRGTSSTGAGVVASHESYSGTDLLLDAGLFDVPTKLYQAGLHRDFVGDTSFSFQNWGLGDLNLSVDGGLTTFASSHNLELIPFYVKLNGDGAQQTIANNGNLNLSVKCIVGPTTKMVQVIAKNSVAGWFDDDHPAGSSYAANQEVTVLQSNSATFPIFRGDFDDFFVVAPSGHYLAIDGETVALGLGAFGSDCIAAGTITSLND